MIKCNITACGTIGRDASMRTTKEEKTFLTFPLRVVLQGKDGRNETVEISVSKEGGQKKVSGYRNGLRVEVAGTLFLKRRGEKLYFNLFADRIGRKPLLYAGLSGVTVSLFALGASFWFADALGDNLKWMAVGSVVVYIASFAFSLGPIGWIVVSEILPLKIRGLAIIFALFVVFDGGWGNGCC